MSLPMKHLNPAVTIITKYDFYACLFIYLACHLFLQLESNVQTIILSHVKSF